MNIAIIALLVVALAISITFNVRDVRDVATRAHRSVAVLPFTSLSTNPENQLFADGIHDDVLTALMNIKSLKVISKTSVMGYRDTTRNLREIGEELGVESVLQGTVQRLGDSVRVNMRLSDAATDRNLWADTFEHRLTVENIFRTQSEISEGVAAALRTTLSPEEQVRVAAMPTTDLRAYRLYKEGRNNLYQRRLETLREAREQFAEAIELDPRYAEAHAGFAEATMLLLINHQDLSQQEAIRTTETSLDRALELDPQLADAYAIRGLMKSTLWGHTQTGRENVEAEEAFRRAIALNPNHASAHMWFASLRNAEERPDEAIELYQRSLELDPLARIPYSNLPQVYASKGLHGQAMELWLEAVRIHGDWPTIYQYIAVELAGLGRYDEAYAWQEKAAELTTEGEIGDLSLAVLIDLGELERARARMDDHSPEYAFYPLIDGYRLMLDGDFVAASAWFGRIAASGSLPGKLVYPMASDSALLAGDLDRAREYALLADPLLAGDSANRINRQTARNAVKLAYIERRRGREQVADELLLETLDVIREQPRLGTYGYGIRDVQIFALLGRKEDALAAFRDALDEGFRGSLMFDGWPLYADPYLDNLRGDPRFASMIDELDGYLAIMRDRLLQAEAAGDLDSLRAMATRT